MKAKAAILVESCKPLVIEEIEIPKLTFGQVLVKVICSGICGAQINEINAVKGPDKFLPHLLGHEATAEVMEIGEGVTTVKVGDRVVMHWRKGAGIHAPTPKYKSKLGLVNSGWVTTFNEYAIASENRVTTVPDNLDPECGALMGCAVTTAFGVLNNDAQVRIGDSVAVFGSGGVGLSVIQGAKMVSAHPIIAIDIVDNKLEMAKKMGATHTINSKNEDVIVKIKEIVGNNGVDIAIETTGNVKVIETAYEVTSASGKTILVGVPKKGEKPSLYTLPLHFEKVLKGTEGGRTVPDRDIPKYIRLIDAGKLDLKQLVTDRYDFDKINDAIADLQAQKIVGRCMINISK
ncbi:MAG: zinc-binding dehydrogenase [Spirochaetes bacterium]|nr:zinc-binding dehydrogenase [Spirochaetota bacterium]